MLSWWSGFSSSSWRRKFVSTALASSGVPSWKVTPGRMVKTYCRPSSDTSQDSASAGSISTVPGLEARQPLGDVVDQRQDVAVAVRAGDRGIELHRRLRNGDDERLAAILQRAIAGRGQTFSGGSRGQRRGKRHGQSQLRRARHESPTAQTRRVQILDKTRKRRSSRVFIVLSISPLRSIKNRTHTFPRVAPAHGRPELRPIAQCVSLCARRRRISCLPRTFAFQPRFFVPPDDTTEARSSRSRAPPPHLCQLRFLASDRARTAADPALQPRKLRFAPSVPSENCPRPAGNRAIPR